ncbi:MAG: sporadic carbohydrate cluster 2OG-Fe(II) oxygenase [Rhodospirillales bacterium]
MSTEQIDFVPADEQRASDAFLKHGHVIVDAEDLGLLNRLRDRIADLAAAHLKIDAPDDAGVFLNGIHERVGVDDLNALRLAVINGLASESWVRAAYFILARAALGTIVGNELVMQRRINLSIQLPNDASSLLPVHADVWSGDSPFEVVMWLPLVDCHRTKSMYLMPPGKDRAVQAKLNRMHGKSSEDLFHVIEDDVTFMDVPFGKVLLFSQTLMHGNRINLEPDTRWSVNCRFKSAFSPYADKKLGEFFQPITLKPASRMAMAYDLPGGFDDE